MGLSRKTAGILTKAAFSSADKTDYVIVGIGINLTKPEDGFHEEIKNIAGALKNEVSLSERDRLVGVFLREFLTFYKAMPEINFYESYKKRLLYLGEEITVREKESFYEADEDFIADNFGELPYVQEAKVFLGSGEKMQEFGIFRLTDRQKASELKMILKDYLATEKEALTSLSTLYPAEELSARLAAYEGAHVGSEGMLVYYFVLECAQAKVALEALNGR